MCTCGSFGPQNLETGATLGRRNSSPLSVPVKEEIFTWETPLDVIEEVVVLRGGAIVMLIMILMMMAVMMLVVVVA